MISREQWQIRKTAVHGEEGIVASQHYLASEVGAQILREGGNAVDAAVAAGLAIGTVEPWSSGIGGGGYMTIYLADRDETKIVEFGMRASFDSTPTDYPLDTTQRTTSAYSFNWPAVIGDTNVYGPLSIAVPGYIRGAALALETFGTMPWQQVIAPAVQLATQGLPVDWFTTLQITNFARALGRFEEGRRVYLSDGLPPLAAGEGSFSYLPLGRLAETFLTLQDEGPESFYSGSIARKLADDLNLVGSRITASDLAEYRAVITDPIQTNYRQGIVQVPGNMTAGPSLLQALGFIEEHTFASDGPSADDMLAYVEALKKTYDYRLKNLGEGANTPTPSHTSHLSVADKFGNCVALTQTIMSPFGSHVMLPQTGMLMNNGMMWFDPRPGTPNSLVGGRHPLCNMCPAVIRKTDGSRLALGACGGRKIFPSVFQLTSFILDFNMSLDKAIHQPRIDVSGNDNVWAMSHMAEEAISALRETYSTLRVRANGIGGNQFAVPQIVQRTTDGTFEGGCFIPSPHAGVVGI